ncbi:predicted protein [Thalassiosira pseudonana CCMP1335]|uniref:Uncharacterized protein n=1 Tax=Thalassiosira pseudonana TaxID=35128 RepID=B8BUS0_THAPS|nr:predicted protein [Thalassiosira pseudonana CCMP1335]EED94809.1 predicted protein [Thalassiosira pseudonana CCMP1335]|mmetsp:Transcript_4668/g.10374  ORF Transcript_4668/g.10374 Transcript_4668/m.10374 type:complete len:249 (-) Transcript_4668:183-929(-)|eukprot:g10191.t1 g10191   contig4:1401346-1402255(-)
MGKASKEPEFDRTSWMVNSDVAQFLTLHQKEVLYMCMLGYTFMHGSKVFAAAPKEASFSYKLVSMILACTGGGILVPIFLNGIPVPLANDAYPIAILLSFAIHYYFPIVREVVKLSPIVNSCFIIMYEAVRAKVVLTFTVAASAAIAPSTFSFPLFGPIMCGTIAGCGGAFLPMSKGLSPIENGMQYPMITAFIGATLAHLFLSTELSEGVTNAKAKVHFHLVLFFGAIGLINGLDLKAKQVVKTKTE